MPPVARHCLYPRNRDSRGVLRQLAESARGARGRPSPATDHRGDARGERLPDQLWADEVDMTVNSTGGQDLALASNNLRAGTNDNIHTGLNVGVARLSDARDSSVPNPDIGF